MNSKNDLVLAYVDSCHTFDVKPNADVLVCFKFQLSKLIISHCNSFDDLDCFALCDCLENAKQANFLESLDFSRTSCSHSSIVALAGLLNSGSCPSLVNLNLGGQKLSFLALKMLLNTNKLERLEMESCKIGNKGALEVLNYISKFQKKNNIVLEYLDLSRNLMSYANCAKLEKISKSLFECKLEGNRVLDEILNAVSHGAGVFLSIIATVALMHSSSSTKHQTSLGVYCTSLLILFLASTLYHSFFHFNKTSKVFQILDHCAIYLLIAGTYTPILTMCFEDKTWLLSVMWSVALIGIGTDAIKPFENFKYEPYIGLSLYVLMGWAAVFLIQEMKATMNNFELTSLFAGGLGYSLGVPFFLKDKHTMGVPDHTLWHLFVLAGAILHFFVIYSIANRL